MKASHISLTALCGILTFSAPLFASAQSNQSAVAVTPATAAQPVAPLRKDVADVVQLSKAGLSENVLVAFVKNAPSSYRLSADDILKLRDAGITAPVIVAMLQHGDELRQQAMQQVAAITAAQQNAQVPQPVAGSGYSTPVFSPAPAVNYAPAYQPYDYGYGYGYGYGYNNFLPEFYFVPTFGLGFSGRFGHGFSGGVRFGDNHFRGSGHFGNVGFGGGTRFTGTPFRGFDNSFRFVGHHR